MDIPVKDITIKRESPLETAPATEAQRSNALTDARYLFRKLQTGRSPITDLGGIKAAIERNLLTYDKPKSGTPDYSLLDPTGEKDSETIKTMLADSIARLAPLVAEQNRTAHLRNSLHDWNYQGRCDEKSGPTITP